MNEYDIVSEIEEMIDSIDLKYQPCKATDYARASCDNSPSLSESDAGALRRLCGAAAVDSIATASNLMCIVSPGTAIAQSCLEESSRATTITQPTHLSLEYVAVQVGSCTPKLDDLMDMLSTEQLTLPAHHGSDVGRAFSVTQVLIVPRLARYLCLHTSSHPLSTLPPRFSRALPKDLPGCQLGLLRSGPP